MKALSDGVSTTKATTAVSRPTISAESKTPHHRRRRKVKNGNTTNSTGENKCYDDRKVGVGMSDKENIIDLSSTTAPRISKNKQKEKDDGDGDDDKKDNKIAIRDHKDDDGRRNVSNTAKNTKSSSSSSNDKTNTKVIQIFRTAVCQTMLRSIFDAAPGLDESVIHLSLQPPTGLWHVQEHAGALIKGTRAWLKQPQSRNVDSESHPLFAILHCIRAVVALKESKYHDTNLKLLYHFITCACHPHNDSLVILSALEAVQQTLVEICLDLDSGNQKVSFKLAATIVGQLKKEKVTVPMAVPTVIHEERSKNTNMTLRQIVTIVLKSYLVGISSIQHFSKEHAESQNNAATLLFKRYGSLTRNIMASNSSEISYLLLQWYTPWLSFVAEIKDPDCHKDLVGHAKAAHRYFWDQAATEKNPEKALKLRKMAIQSIVPRTASRKSTHTQKLDQEGVVFELIDMACTYAWKAASVYVHARSDQELPVSAPNPLFEFHEQIENMIIEERAHSILTLPYVEYTVHKAIHCGCQLLNDHNEDGFDIENGDDCDINTTIRLIALCGVRTKHQFERRNRNDTSKDNESRWQSIFTAIVSKMQCIIEKWKELSWEQQSRYFRLLMTISLHRCIFQALKAMENGWTTEDRATLEQMAGLLQHCIAPLLSHTVKLCPDESKESSMMETVLESFVRPLAAWEKLREVALDEEESFKFEKLANETMRKMHRLFLVESSTTKSLVEKCAKAIALITRQRSELSCNESAIVSTLYSLTFYQYLDQLLVSTNTTFSNQYQLAARYAHLAQTLQESGFRHHAMVILTFVIVKELPLCYSINNGDDAWDENHILEFLISRSKNALGPTTSLSKFELTTLAKTSLRRLTTLAQEERSCSRTCNESVKEDSIEPAWKIFMGNQGMKSEMSVLADLLTLALNNLSHSVGEQQKLILSFLIKIDLILEVGSISKRTEETTSWMCNEIQGLLDCLELPFKSNMCSKTIPVVASLAMVPEKCLDLSRPINLEHCTDFFARFLENAKRKIDFSNSQADLHNHFLSGSLHHVCSWLSMPPSTETPLVVTFKKYEEIMSFFRMQKSISMTPRDEYARNVFLWTLNHFQCEVETCGDISRSITITNWILEIVKDSSDWDHIWFRSVFTSTQLTHPLTISTVTSSRDNTDSLSDFLLGSMEWLAQIEYDLTSLRVQLLSGNYSFDADEAIKKASSEIKDFEFSCNKPDAMSHWLCSSLHLASAEYEIARGTFVQALDCLQESCRSCMRVISISRSTSKPNHDEPYWAHIARSTLLSKAKQRYMTVLGKRSRVFSRIGDHRKATAYLAALLDFAGVEMEATDKNNGPQIQELLAITSDFHNREARRLSMEIRCSALSYDSVAKGFADSRLSWLVNIWSDSDDFSTKIQEILDVVSVGDIVYGESVKSPFQSAFLSFYQESLNQYSKATITSQFQSNHSYLQLSETRLSAKLALREIRCLLGCENQHYQTSQARIQELIQRIVKNPVSDISDRAWAYYYAAEMEMSSLSTVLDNLWNGEDDEVCISNDDMAQLTPARDLLLQAAALHNIGSDILSRNILRSLALVTGPENSTSSDNSSSGAFVLMSIGQSYRHQMIRSLADVEHGDSRTRSHLREVFSALEESELACSAIFDLLDKLYSLVPDNWKFVAATLCPTGDLLITSIYRNTDLKKMALETSRIESREAGSIYDDMMLPLDAIVEASQSQLSGMDIAAVSEKFNKEEAKRLWWDGRHKLDASLEDLLERIELTYFPNIADCSHFGSNIFASSETTSLPVGNLVSKFEAAVKEAPGEQETQDSLRKLTIPLLKDRLRKEFGCTDSSFRRLKKQDLIDLYLSESNRAQEKNSDVSSSGCLFLILDENLHRFPFEGLPSLFGNTVCRVPSLSFVLATLLERNTSDHGGGHVVDPAAVSYLLDPENNLRSTRQRLCPVLKEISDKNDWDWNGIVGTVPETSFFEENLLRPSSVFMFFGHGGAQTFFPRREVEGLANQSTEDLSARGCQSTVILMGCSSGRLVSVNRKHSNSTAQLPLYYEPEGIALSYLFAGAPCVIGNLWDVTDRDIDRYSTTLLEQFFDQDGKKTLNQCVATSRSACKLQFIVGCAPVCYGIPVHLIKKS